MDHFKKSNTIKLRNRHGKYLFADDDECAVSQSREGSKLNAVWTVEFDEEDALAIKLKSCYNCYLSATNVPFLLGMTGKKVLQMKLVDSESSVVWEPIKDGFSVKLRTRASTYLRANGSIPPWRNSVTHDSAHKQDWFLWEVEPVGNVYTNKVESQGISMGRIPSPVPSIPSFTSQPSISSVSSFNEPSPTPKPKLDGRIIHYAVADDDGEIPDAFESEFLFKGDDVKMLTEKMKEEVGIDEELYVCAKNHFNNKLFPLLLHLPPNNAPMYVVVVKASSKLAKTLPGVVVESEHVGRMYNRTSSLDDD